jgi:hypothetical protein
VKVTEVRNESGDPRIEALRHLLGSFRISQALYVAAKLGVPDLLATGAKSADDLARATGTHSPSLRRVLRLLAAIGILSEREVGVFALTPLGEEFRAGARGNLRTIAISEGEMNYGAFGAMLHTVKTGESGYEHVHGRPVFQHLMANPERAQQFQDTMTAGATLIAESVVDAYDFSQFETLVDVGGGHGVLLATVLRANSSARGILFDRSYVVAGARELLERAGVLDRCEIRNGEFFKSVPSGGDAYLMSRVIHDWGDERATTILQNCRAAMQKRGKVLVIDRLVEVGGEPNDPQTLMTLFSDLTMLALGGGMEAKERTLEEFRALFGASGFELTRAIPTRSGYFIIEGCAA